MFGKHKNKEKYLAPESSSRSPARSFIRKLLPLKESRSKEDIKKRHQVTDPEARSSSATVPTLTYNQCTQPPSPSNRPSTPDEAQEHPKSNSSSGSVHAIRVPEDAEPESLQPRWNSGLTGKGMTVLRIIGLIAGVPVDTLGPLEKDVSGKTTIRAFCTVLSKSITSLLQEGGSNIEPMRDSLTSLSSDLSGITMNVEGGNIGAEDARWRVTNLLQMVLLESNLSGHISLDIYSKIENHLTDMQDKGREEGLRQAITHLPFTNAAYNDYASTGHRRVACFEGTRQELLKEVGEWVAKSESNIYVLFGLAGIGKSTIAQTVSKSADSIGLLGASFFFSRDEADRKTAKLFFTTIAFQLCVFDKEFADAIESVLRTEKGKAATVKLPLEQLETLILEPLAKLCPRKVVIVVDALDECDDEEAPTVLMGLHNLVRRLPSFKVIVTTRPQPYVQFHLEGSHKTFHLHNIDDKIVDGDIRSYLKYKLSTKEVQIHFKSTKEDWNASDAEIESLVQAAGRLFIIASTSVLFILDKAAHDPERRMKYLVEAIAQDKTPFDALNNFYTVILRSALPKGRDTDAVRRYQTIIGAIIVLQIPLGIETIAKLIDSRPLDIHRVLEKLQAIILVDDASNTPRIYHKSFPDYIQDSERCVDDDFRVDPKAHHTQVAIYCFRVMARYLKQNILELDDPARFMDNDDALEEQGVTDAQLQEKIPLELRYACLYFANHMEGANTEDRNLLKELQAFTNERLLGWFETLSWIGKLDSTYQALLIVLNHMKTASPDVHQLLTDALRFIAKFYDVIKSSALHTYHSALPFTPKKTSLYNKYSKQMSSFCQVQGVREEWGPLVVRLATGFNNIHRVIFSLDNTMLACQMSGAMTIYDATGGIQIGTIKGEVLAIACDFSKIAASEDGTITLYHGKGVIPVATIKILAEAQHLELSSDGSRLLAVLVDGTLSAWDTDEGKLIVTSARWMGRRLSVISSNATTGALAITLDDGPSIFVVNLSSCDFVVTLDCSVFVKELPMSLAGFSRDGSRLAYLVNVGETSTLILWNSKDGTFLGAAHDAGENFAISENGSLLATWEGKTLKLWNGNNGNPLLVLKTLNLHNQIALVAFSQNDLLAVAYRNHNRVILYNISSDSFLPKLRFTDTTTISFSSDRCRLAAGNVRGTVYLWDIPSIEAQERPSNSTTLSFSPDCSRLVSGHEDGSIKLWDTSDMTVPASICKDHSKKITALAFNADGGEFASGSEDGIIAIWDAKDGASNGHLECFEEKIDAIAMSSPALVVATISRIFLCDIKDRSITATLAQTGVFRLTLSDNRSLLAISSSYDMLIVWDIKKRASLAVFYHTWHYRSQRMVFTDGDSKLVVWDDFVKLFNICRSDSDHQQDFKENIVCNSQEIIRLGLLPCWHGIPVWIDSHRDVVGLFPQQKKPITLLSTPWGINHIECGSSMIALANLDGTNGFFVINVV